MLRRTTELVTGYLDESPYVDFGVLSNDFQHQEDFPASIGGGWGIDRATLGQAELISPVMRALWATSDFPFPRQETQTVPSGEGWATSVLPPKSWRYTIIRPMEEEFLEGSLVSEALRISEADAVVELWAVTPQGDGKLRVQGDLERCRRELNEWWKESDGPRQLDLDDVRRCVQLRCDLSAEGHQELKTALVRFRQLDSVPEGDLKVLGYFSILESLLAHKPKPEDTYDSITRQLQRNLILLGNRVDEVQLFGNVQLAPKKAVTRMYGARSVIAHGRSDLSDVSVLIQNYSGPELISPIADKEHPDSIRRWFSYFIRSLTRRILRCALIEPQLVNDLTLD